ncbi:MAG: exopolyphosphatase [Steroidobacteraceae bacterium]
MTVRPGRRAGRRAAPEVLAAVDLGSNSFHMIVARRVGRRLVVLDRLREPVRLAAGMDGDGRLSREAVSRALATLQRFGQRLREMHADGVRVVGTNALRKARRQQAFLERARAVLGHPIEVISGIEEARLIYLGVSHSLPMARGRRLVVDIGGGSTELILGRHAKPLRLESLYMGCVSMSERHFSGGRVSARRMQQARLAAQQELESISHPWRDEGWVQAVASSGTARAIMEAIRDLEPSAKFMTPGGLGALTERLVRAGSVSRAGLASIAPDRVPVFAGGVAIMAQVFETLGLQEVQVADTALREGLLLDMLGRLTDVDVRRTTIASLEKRFHVDAEQASRVEATASALLAQVAAPWSLEDPDAAGFLGWAARLHEVGLGISHAHFHRHGAYLLEHADMPGFSREDQRLLAVLVAAHRRKFQPQKALELPPPWNDLAPRLCMLLRLAVILNRSRHATTPVPRLTVRGRGLDARFPRGWLRAHPLTVADLELERAYLSAARYRLSYS